MKGKKGTREKKKRKGEKREKRERNIYTNVVNDLTIVDLIVLEDTSNPSTRSTMMKISVCCVRGGLRWFSSKSSFNRHVKDLQHTKSVYLNSAFPEGFVQEVLVGVIKVEVGLVHFLRSFL